MAVIVNAIHKRTERQRGQALVETALSMMIILVLLLGMVDFGIAFGYRVALDQASRSGARFGSRLPGETALITNAIVDSLKGTLVLASDYDHATPDPELHITIACEMIDGSPIACNLVPRGERIIVTVGYDYQPLFGGFLGITEVPITSRTIMAVIGGDLLGP